MQTPLPQLQKRREGDISYLQNGKLTALNNNNNNKIKNGFMFRI
jgi:hypothetical protein